VGAPYWLMLKRVPNAGSSPHVRLRALSACWTVDMIPLKEPAPAWTLLAEWPPAAPVN
jgi:hypothetical protein